MSGKGLEWARFQPFWYFELRERRFQFNRKTTTTSLDIIMSVIGREMTRFQLYNISRDDFNPSGTDHEIRRFHHAGKWSRTDAILNFTIFYNTKEDHNIARYQNIGKWSRNEAISPWWHFRGDFIQTGSDDVIERFNHFGSQCEIVANGNKFIFNNVLRYERW